MILVVVLKSGKIFTYQTERLLVLFHSHHLVLLLQLVQQILESQPIMVMYQMPHIKDGISVQTELMITHLLEVV